MDFVISFFRDTLDGALYIVVAIICGILICSCIGYLGEQYLKKKQAKKEFESTYVNVDNGAVSATVVADSNVPISQGVTATDSNVTSVNQNQ